MALHAENHVYCDSFMMGEKKKNQRFYDQPDIWAKIPLMVFKVILLAPREVFSVSVM